MKNILDFDKHPVAHIITSLDKKQARYLFDQLVETFDSLLNVFSNKAEKRNDVACKRDFIKAHCLRLQSLYPVSDSGWQKLICSNSPYERYDMQDIFNLSRNIFNQSFIFVDNYTDLETPYLYYIIKKEPETWKEIFSIFQERDVNKRIGIVDFLLKIESKIAQELIAKDKEFILEHFSELLQRRRDFPKGDFWIYQFPWLRDYLPSMFTDKYRSIWEPKLSIAGIWNVILHDNNKAYFDECWSKFDEEKRKEFLKLEHGHRTCMLEFLETFSAEEKEKLAEYIEMEGSDFFKSNQHLWWVSQGKLLDYLKKHAPINNILMDLIRLLKSRININTELLSKSELQQYMDFLITKYGKDNHFIDQAIKTYQK